MSNKTFTGRTRQRKTSNTVRFADGVARWVIACGGIGTIVAVLTVCVYLVAVVLPLFLPAATSDEKEAASSLAANATPLHFGVDEYQLLGTAVEADGSFRAVRLDTGKVIDTQAFLKDLSPTCAAFTVDGRNAAFGFSDGQIRLAKFGFLSSYPSTSELPEDLQKLAPGEIREYEGGLLVRTDAEQLRLQKPVAQAQEPIDLKLNSPIRLIDYAQRPSGPMYCVLTEDGKLQLELIRKRENKLTLEVITTVRHSTLPYKPATERGFPQHLLLSGQGDSVYLAWADGRLLRFDVSDVDDPKLAEELDLVPEPDRKLTALKFLAGRSTLVAGDSSGLVRAYFCIKPKNTETTDGALLVKAHELPGPASAVTALSVSSRSRMLAVGYADGSARIYNVTNRRLLAEVGMPGKGQIESVALAPKDNGLFALGRNQLASWEFDPKYPEATFASIFMPLWYEGYESPGYVWQSSSGSDDFEPKLGLVPLVFGTLKATFYSMLFGVPLALMAAVYTSEFLAPSAKSKVKPVIEMMASLPSVVLGFLAGIVIAPMIENIVPETIACFFTIPFVLLLGAHLWQLLPQELSLLLAHYRLLFVALVLPLGVWLGAALGPLLERVCFAGDLRAWLDGQIGSGVGGWVLLLMPLSAIATALVLNRQLGPVMRKHGGDWSRLRWASFDLIKFLAATGITLVVAYLVGALLNLVGWDPRGSLVGTYVQRNALIVGFVMGFAVIPLIYTIADDALSTVPAHLRSASLGAGATPWQTAFRIIIPTAMSGLFSAVMIGLGRAVGETMIVLMAAGNTPIMDLNIFNGFQTLSALIATELPEAVKDSTHYRSLFLAALTLFLLTFFVNTFAEWIRMRFRRRAYEL